MEPWQSWGIVGVVGVGVYWYYSNQHEPKQSQGRAAIPFQQGQRRDSLLQDGTKDRRKRANTSGTSSQGASDAADVSSASAPTSGTDRLKKRKGGKNQPSQLAHSSAIEVSEGGGADIGSGNSKEPDMDNKEFARQLAGLKTGTSLNRPSGTNEMTRTRKQGKRSEMQPETANGAFSKSKGLLGAQDKSTASSTTGADADDDLSPAMSPEFGATESTGPPGGVSDMLEAPAKGPSVLRLTEPAVSRSVRQSKPQKHALEPESKKQRQNRQKNEEKKLAREQAEKERRVILEKQLRTAREAEGRPARNGLAFSKGPSTNAWTTSSHDSVPMTPDTPTGNGLLLDTFDKPSASATTGDQRQTNGTPAGQKTWDGNLPSEEDQMRMLNELDNDGWNTVEKGGKGKKKASVKTEEPEKTLRTNGQKTQTPGYKSHNETKNITENGNGLAKLEPAMSSNPNGAPRPAITSDEPKRKKATKEDVDPNVWNRSNIHNHPDYDPELPYALTGHPDDDDWAVV